MLVCSCFACFEGYFRFCFNLLWLVSSVFFVVTLGSGVKVLCLTKFLNKKDYNIQILMIKQRASL